jgi:membrane dipeptidase
MMIRTVFLTVVLVAVVSCAPDEDVMTLDTHIDVLPINEIGEWDYLDVPEVQVDIGKMEAGGLDAAFFILFSQQGELTPEGHQAAEDAAMARYASIRRMLDSHPQRIELARTVEQARKIKASGKLVAFLGMENGYPLAKNPANLEKFYELGVRYIGLLHMGHNGLGDSANPNESIQEAATVHGGLSDAGREVVAEANRLGIMVDVSHAHRDTAIEMARVSTAPVIASHSSVRALADIPRNMDDEQLLAVKRSGGVVQIVAFRRYLKKGHAERLPAIMALAREVGFKSRHLDVDSLSPEMREKYLRERAEIDRKWPAVTANVADFVDHIDYAVRLLGIDHVGIASDFGGGGGVDGWDNAAETQNVTSELISRGYTDEEIRKIWSGNLLRVMSDVEAHARKLAEAQQSDN